MRSLIIAVYILLSLQNFAQTDSFKTPNGTINIQPIVHGTLVITYNNTTVYVDPYGGAEKFEGLPNADLILITDIHGDHMNIETLDGLHTKKSQFVVPQAVADKLPEAYKKQLNILNNGQSIHREGIYITAIPMYNLPETDDSRHPKGRGNGYVLNIDGTSLYISGDTEDIPEMRALQEIDIAFVCMNLPYTMDIQQAASAVLEFKPKMVYPFHYRGKPDFSDVEAFKRLVNQGDSSIEVRLRDWYAK